MEGCVTMYRRMSVANATSFRQSNKGYNTYLCNFSNVNNLTRKDADTSDTCAECTYLINEKKKKIQFSDLMNGKYDVIFVSPDEPDVSFI